MAEPVQIPEAERWKSRLARAKKHREQWEMQYKVELCEKFLLGEQSTDPDDLVFNHFRPTMQGIIPSLFFSMPSFLVRSKPGRSEPVSDSHAAAAEGLLNAIAAQGDRHLERVSRLALAQTFFRYGVLKVCYDPRLEPNPQAGQPIYQTNAAGEPILDPRTGVPQIDPMTGQPMVDPQTGMPVMDMSQAQPMPLIDPATGQPLMEPDVVVTDEAYRWEWVDARRMLFPDEGPDPGRWSWIAEQVVVPLEEAKADERFPAELRALFQANEGKKESKAWDAQASDPQSDDELFAYYDCYDIRKKQHYLLADGQLFDDFLLKEPLPQGIDDHPYALLLGWQSILGPEPSPFPLPHTQPWVDVQKEYNIRQRQIREGAKRGSRKILHTEDTFKDEDEAYKALRSPLDMQGVKIKSMSQAPVVMEVPDLNPGIYRDVASLMTDWRIITGQTGARMGTPTGRTATEANFSEQAITVRESDMRNAVSSWLAVAGAKMLQLLKATLTLDMWVRIRGVDDDAIKEYAERIYGIAPEMLIMFPGVKDMLAERLGQQKWERATREKLTFEAEVTVMPGSTRPRSLDVERAQWLEFLNIIGQYPQLALSRALLEETAAKYDFVNTRMLDELAALAKQMIQINQTQAGRGGAEGGDAGGVPSDLGAMLSNLGR